MFSNNYFKGSLDKYVVVTTWYNGIGQTLNEDDGIVNSAIFATTVHPSQDIQVLAGPVTASLKILEVNKRVWLVITCMCVCGASSSHDTPLSEMRSLL